MDFCTIFLIIFILYWIISLICFIFPIRKNKFIFKNFIYQQLLSNNCKENSKVILDVAHRGGPQESFENTIKAFKHSKSLGINCLEMDVHLTKDKKLVVIHDTELDRLCGVKGKVSDFNFEAFPKYQNKIQLHFSASGTMENQQTNEEQICLLDDVFKAFPNSIYNIELKDESEAGIQAFYEIVKKNNIDDKIIWGSRHYQWTKKLKEIAPHIPVFFSAEGVLKVFLSFFLGLLPFIQLHYNSLQVPLFTKEFFNWKKQESKSFIQYICTLIMQEKFLIFQLRFGTIKIFSLALPYIITHLKKRGIITMLWVLNETEDFDRAINYGAQGIMTDRPSLLKQYLSKNHLSID